MASLAQHAENEYVSCALRTPTTASDVVTDFYSFPPIRACIFDMDGLLIDSEDAYTHVTNTILHENGRPTLPWHIKAQLQGRPGPAAGKIFHGWAQLPISHDEFPFGVGHELAFEKL